ncbi:MAG: hypothetical protein ABEJ65_00915 [bacterium]
MKKFQNSSWKRNDTLSYRRHMKFEQRLVKKFRRRETMKRNSNPPDDSAP